MYEQIETIISGRVFKKLQISIEIFSLNFSYLTICILHTLLFI